MPNKGVICLLLSSFSWFSIRCYATMHFLVGESSYLLKFLTSREAQPTFRPSMLTFYTAIFCLLIRINNGSFFRYCSGFHEGFALHPRTQCQMSKCDSFTVWRSRRSSLTKSKPIAEHLFSFQRNFLHFILLDCESIVIIITIYL